MAEPAGRRPRSNLATFQMAARIGRSLLAAASWWLWRTAGVLARTGAELRERSPFPESECSWRDGCRERQLTGSWSG